MAAILPAAIARFPLSLIESGGPPVFFGLTDMFIFAYAAYDLFTSRRVHPTTVWSGVAIVASQLMSLFAGGTAIWHERATRPARLMFLGGATLEPRYIWWNFVSSRRERIEQAKEVWKTGAPVPGETEFIPLPEP